MGSGTSRGSSDSGAASVFLGGACGETTWRARLAIPRLERAGVTYYNPQVDEWHEGLIAVEDRAKRAARFVLVVIGSETSACASMIEAAELAASEPARLVLVLQEYADPDAGTPKELAFVKDFNRGRAYLRALARRRGLRVFDSLDDALAHIVGVHSGRQNRM